jgi:hypothetical protein
MTDSPISNPPVSPEMPNRFFCDEHGCPKVIRDEGWACPACEVSRTNEASVVRDNPQPELSRISASGGSVSPEMPNVFLCCFNRVTDGHSPDCARALPAKEETPRTWLNPKKLANDAVQRLADSEPTEDSIEGMERLRGTPQESMFVVNAAELQRVIECTLEDAIYDSRSSQPSSSSEITEAIDDLWVAGQELGASTHPRNRESFEAKGAKAAARLESLYREQLQEIGLKPRQEILRLDAEVARLREVEADLDAHYVHDMKRARAELSSLKDSQLTDRARLDWLDTMGTFGSRSIAMTEGRRCKTRTVAP